VRSLTTDCTESSRLRSGKVKSYDDGKKWWRETQTVFVDSAASGRVEGNEGKLHFNLIGRRNSKLSQRKRSSKVPSRCNRMIEPALSQLSANGPGVLDKKERAANPTGHWKDGLIATGYTSCERKIILGRMTVKHQDDA